MTNKTDSVLDPERQALVRFRGRKVKVRYGVHKHEEYGYLWLFVSRELNDLSLTDAQHASVTRQIRCHAERRERRRK